MHLRSRPREPHVQKHRPDISAELSSFPIFAQERGRRELQFALLDKSVKTKFQGGTLAQYDQSGKLVTSDVITRIELDQDGLRIKTYSKLDLHLARSQIFDSDATFREENGVIYIDLILRTYRYAIAPKGKNPHSLLE